MDYGLEGEGGWEDDGEEVEGGGAEAAGEPLDVEAEPLIWMQFPLQGHGRAVPTADGLRNALKSVPILKFNNANGLTLTPLLELLHRISETSAESIIRKYNTAMRKL